MPIYEFYCHRCHRLYNFFSRRVNVDTVPLCPRCKTVKLKRQMSLFAHISGDRKEKEDDQKDVLPPIDESRLEQAMGMLANEVEKVNEDDPRQAAQLVRKLTEATGVPLGAAMEEALTRLEAGEDPDVIEEEMGERLENEEPFLLSATGPKGKSKSKRRPPEVDETLYELT